MAFDQREESFGLGHAGEPELRELRTQAIIGAIAGLAFVSTWWWLPPPVSDSLLGLVAQQLFAWIAPLIGLSMIAYSLLLTRRLLRLGGKAAVPLSILRRMGPVSRVASAIAAVGLIATVVSQLSEGPAALAQSKTANGEANRRAKILVDKDEAGIGFLASSGEAQGFFNCRLSEDNRPTKIAIAVGRFENATVRTFEDHWLVDDIRVPMTLELRIDGQSFRARDTRVSPSLGGPALVGGWLPYSDKLHKALTSARFLELVSGDRVISVSTVGEGAKLTALTNLCDELELLSEG